MWYIVSSLLRYGFLRWPQQYHPVLYVSIIFSWGIWDWKILASIKMIKFKNANSINFFSLVYILFYIFSIWFLLTFCVFKVESVDKKVVCLKNTFYFFRFKTVKENIFHTVTFSCLIKINKWIPARQNDISTLQYEMHLYYFALQTLKSYFTWMKIWIKFLCFMCYINMRFTR